MWEDGNNISMFTIINEQDQIRVIRVHPIRARACVIVSDSDRYVISSKLLDSMLNALPVFTPAGNSNIYR
jgi:hypothetical protein